MYGCMSVSVRKRKVENQQFTFYLKFVLYLCFVKTNLKISNMKASVYYLIAIVSYLFVAILAALISVLLGLEKGGMRLVVGIIFILVTGVLHIVKQKYVKKKELNE